jgi:hypothetical protein
MEWEKITSKRHPGFGQCIYCGSDGGVEGLRDEHAIPFALGGNLVIEKGSCRRCEQKIAPVDTHLGRSVYGQHRIHVNAPTRNRKERPATLPANFTVMGDNVTLDLPIQAHPYSLLLPVWGDAGFFRCAAIDAPFPETYFHAYHWLPPSIRETLRLADDKDYKVWASGRVDTTLFARGIAKIAYCNMVARFGVDGFRRLTLPALVLGTFSGVPYFVGASLNEPPPRFGPEALHTVQFSELFARSGTMKLLICAVRLFAHSGSGNHGMPIYHVIVGAPKPDHRLRQPMHGQAEQ